MIIKHTELKVGDIVRLLPETDDPFMDTVVEKIEQKDSLLAVTLFRPYVSVHVGFNSPSVINPLIGIERYTTYLHSGHTYRLMRRDSK